MNVLSDIMKKIVGMSEENAQSCEKTHTNEENILVEIADQQRKMAQAIMDLANAIAVHQKAIIELYASHSQIINALNNKSTFTNHQTKTEKSN